MLKTRTLLTILLITTLLGASQSAFLDNENHPQQTQSRQDSVIGAACEGLTFEDMFEYSYARFEVDIASDYSNAYVSAVAYINQTLSDIVRTDLDELVGEVGINGGGNGKLSTHEENLILDVTDDCIVETNPRFGFRTGEPHRGGDGVNWKNASWINDESNPLQLQYFLI